MRASALRAAFLCGTLGAVLAALPVSRGAAEGAEAICGGTIACIDQGWNDRQRAWWYSVSQGSRLLPLAWMKALEQPNSSHLFLDPDNVARLGYLPNPASNDNPEGLPLGFAVDEDRSRAADLMCDRLPTACYERLMRQKWVGLNCAACHTGEIELGDRRLRIEGAPGQADFQTFEEEILASLETTLADPTRFARFAGRVLSGGGTAGARAVLEAELREQIAWQRDLAGRNATAVRYGHGRLDAQGHILNKVAATTGLPKPARQVGADAPASYPFVWNTSQQGRIQWNGIANNIAKIDFLGYETDAGALVRNTSEVVGVFAHIDTKGEKALFGYDSSVRMRAMVSLERQLARLFSPRWPEAMLGPIDSAKAQRGKLVFDRMECRSCHQPLAWNDTASDLHEVMTPLTKSGTDVFLACNTFVHRSPAGDFAGQKVFGLTGDAILPFDATRQMLVNTAIGAIAGELDQVLLGVFTDVAPRVRTAPSAAPGLDNREFLPGVTNGAKKAQAGTCLTTDDPILAYKARSLNGIWATAPYLHNGSVPTLYDLLLPGTVRLTSDVPEPAGTERRPETFGTGSRRFDGVKVGFVTDVASSPSVFRVRDPVSGEPIPGNYNSGHDYGTADLPDADRWDLVEYLKTL